MQHTSPQVMHCYDVILSRVTWCTIVVDELLWMKSKEKQKLQQTDALTLIGWTLQPLLNNKIKLATLAL